MCVLLSVLKYKLQVILLFRCNMCARIIVFEDTIPTFNRDSVVGYELDDQDIVVRFPVGNGLSFPER